MVPVGGLSEYAVIATNRAAKKPPSIDALTAASSLTAAAAVRACQFIEPGDRVLILGGSGGVGSAAIQLAKAKGASFVATTSTRTELVQRCGADAVVDHTRENWWEHKEFLH